MATDAYTAKRFEGLRGRYFPIHPESQAVYAVRPSSQQSISKCLESEMPDLSTVFLISSPGSVSRNIIVSALDRDDHIQGVF